MLLANTSRLATVDLVVIIIYFAIMLMIGVYFFRVMRGLKDYFSGGRRIPWWLSGISHYMSTFSTFAFIANSALVYQYGLVGIVVFWAQIPATLLCALVFAQRWRRARIDSPVEFLEARFGPTMRQLVVWHGVPVKIVDDALKLLAIAIFIAASTGFPESQGVLWAGIVILAYTFMGGLWGVMVTDFVQFVVMLAAVFVLLGLSLSASGGLAPVLFEAPENFFSPINDKYGWVYLGSMVFLYGLTFTSVHWQLIQRFYSVPDERESKKMGLLVVGLQFVTPALMFLPALAAHQIFTEPVVPRDIYPTLCNHLLPVGLIGLMVAAMLAATMSMLSSDYNVVASVLTNDVYRRLVRPNASPQELIRVGRGATLVVGLAALSVAYPLVGLDGEGLFRKMVQLFSIATAPVALPMILGLVWKRMTGAGALSGFGLGITTGIVLYLSLPSEVYIAGLLFTQENIILFGTSLSCVGAMWVVSMLVPQSAAEQARVEPFLAKLATPIGQLPEDRRGETSASSRAVSPFRIVGVCVVAVALLMIAVSPFVGGGLALMLNLGVGIGLLLFGLVLIWRGAMLTKTTMPVETKPETTA